MYIGFSRAVFNPDARIASGLLLAFVALLPAEPLYNLPAIALAILGVVGLVSGNLRLGAPENRFLWVAFLCIWLPMVASLPDAINFPESARKTASVCVYFLVGIYAVGAYRRFAELDWIMWGVGAICGFWVLDALWQFWTGVNWFGVSYEDGSRLPGMFSTGRIGYILASFAPLVFEAVRRSSRRWRVDPGAACSGVCRDIPVGKQDRVGSHGDCDRRLSPVFGSVVGSIIANSGPIRAAWNRGRSGSPGSDRCGRCVRLVGRRRPNMESSGTPRRDPVRAVEW